METENELIMRIGLIDAGEEYALRQLLRFFDVLATGLAVVPELSTVFEGIDWRIVLTPITEQASAEIFGGMRPSLITTG